MSLRNIFNMKTTVYTISNVLQETTPPNASEKPKGFGARHTQMILSISGMAIVCSMRSNMSVSIVAMTDVTVNPSFSHFKWTEFECGIILSGINLGCIMSPIISGILAKKIGPKILLITTGIVQGVLTMCISIIAEFGWEYVFILRILQGAAQGFIQPCIFTLLAKWLPPCERNLISLITGGGMIGTVLTMSLSGVIASSSIGWPGIFYFTGGLSILWSFFVILFCCDTPANHKTITNAEKQFIQLMPDNNNEMEQQHRLSIPWKKVFRSKPFWAVIISQWVQYYGFTMLLSYIPLYIDGILGFDIESNALFSSIPYLAMIVVIFICTKIATIITKNNYLSIGYTRKLFNTIGFIAPMICLLILGNINNTIYSVLSLLTIGLGLSGAGYNGYFINQVDLSPNFAGALIGCGQTFGMIAAIIAPIFAGYIVKDIHDAFLWNIVFSSTAALYFIAGVSFLIFGSGKIQSWNQG